MRLPRYFRGLATPSGFILRSVLVVLAVSCGALTASSQEAEKASRQQVEALAAQVRANGDANVLAQLQSLAETSTPAMVALGDLYARGSGVQADGAKAAQYYEGALTRGDNAPRTRLGLLYRDGNGLPANPARAFELLSEAAKGGDRWAMYHLAQGHLRRQFGAASRPAEGPKLLEQAMAAGNPQAVVALSNLHLWGNGGLRRDPKRAVTLLEQAADQGNGAAARALIAIYRDGRGRLIARSPKRASALLAKYGKLLNSDLLANEKLLQDSTTANTPASRKALLDGYMKADQAERKRMLLSLRAGNPNGYVYIVQDRLKAAGRYRGAVNGRLDNATIRAVNSFCAAEKISAECRRGPLSAPAAAAIADALGKTRSGTGRPPPSVRG